MLSGWNEGATLPYTSSVCGMNHITHRLKTHTHLIEFVDVDLTLFVSLWTHIHGSSNQKDVSVTVTVDVMCLEDAAKIGANLIKKNIIEVETIWG